MKKNNLYEELLELLKEQGNGYFDSDGRPLKQKIVEEALKLEPKIIKAVLKNENLKKHFTVDVDGITVFDKVKFQRFVSNKMYLSDSYTQFLNKMGLVDPHGELLRNKDDVVLVWPYKDCVLQGGQTKEDDKRNEIFYNEILAYDEITRLCKAKAFCNFKYIDKDGEKNFKSFPKKPIIENNFIIKGNNLLALHSLKEVYQGKIKLIYIDPPYNTGGEANIFSYNNTYNHSTWLTFMRNRLVESKELLKDDGFIAIAIDHFEIGYLIVLADEIFKRENRIGIVSILHNPEGRQNAKYFTVTNEFLLVYRKSAISEFNPVYLQENFKDSKDIESIFGKKDERGYYKEESFIRIGGGDTCLRENKPNGWYPIFVNNDLKDVSLQMKENYIEVLPITESGQERTWKLVPSSFIEKFQAGDIYAKKERGAIKIFEKYRIDKGSPITTCWINKKYNSKKNGTNLLENMFGEKCFSYPKSLYSVLDVLRVMTNKNDIILDFFAGSGTTAQAVLELNKEDGGNRKFVLCEQMDYVETITKERVKKVIENQNGGSFIYMEIKKQNQEWIDKIDAAETKEELFNLWNDLKNNVYLSYKVKPEDIDESKKGLGALDVSKFKDFLKKVLDKNALYLNYSDIEDKEMNLSNNEKYLNWEFYEEEM